MAAKKRRKRRRPRERGAGTPRRSGGGMLQSMQAGFRQAAGVEKPKTKRAATLTNVFWGVVMAIALGVLAYRFLF